ncbi:MAG: cell division protein SepF [Clostridiaceae bacterium]|nr:cell division protein SepF [Clostridiaceae bacterium]
MGLFDNLKRYVRGEDYEEDERLEEEEAGEESTRRWRATEPAEHEDRAERPSYERTARAESRPSSSGKVVSIHTVTQLSVVLVKPERYEQAADIADHLKDKRTVVLNLEQTNREVARRLLDFLSGVAYANEGKTTKVANSTYIITPYNVEIQGDIIDELENNGLYV